MKQFNLDEYLANPSRKVVTGDGRNVRIICTDSKIRNYPIIALVEEPSRFENLFSYTEGGQMVQYEPGKKYGQFFASEKHQGWVNRYRDSKSDELCWRYIFPSEEEAKRNAASDIIATAKIEWVEQ